MKKHKAGSGDREGLGCGQGRPPGQRNLIRGLNEVREQRFWQSGLEARGGRCSVCSHSKALWPVLHCVATSVVTQGKECLITL